MNRMGPIILILAATNALAGAAMAGAGAAVVIFIGIVAAGWLFFRNRGEVAGQDTPRRAAAAQPNVADRQGAPPIVVGRQGTQLLVRVGDRDHPARAAAGSPMPGYGDPVVIEGTEGDVLVVRMHARR